MEERGADVDATDGGGWTPAMQAAYGDHVDALQYLISKGANLEKRNNAPYTHDKYIDNGDTYPVVDTVSLCTCFV